MPADTTPALSPLLSAWAATLRCRGGAPALYAPDGTVRRSFAQIEAEAGHWATALPPEWRPGHVVAIQIGNRPEWPALLLALARRGLVTLPLGGHLGVAERDEALRCTAAVGRVFPNTEGTLLFEAASSPPPPSWPEPRPELLKLTSGTTAAPRVIRFRTGQLVADARAIMETMGFGPEDLNFGVIPVAHSYGFSNLLTPLLVGGVPLVLSEDRMPRAILDGLAATGASVFAGMPVFFDKLASLDAPPPLPRLRLCISAGAPLTPEVGERFSARFGLRIHSFYGSSECGGIAYDRVDTGGYEPGRVGLPLAGVAVTPREDGRITVRSPAVGDGYWPPSPEGDAALCGGAFTPGDLVRVDEAGELVIEGRLSDVINIAGRKLNPAEVEAVLRRCPGVREVVVFGVPSRLRNEEAVACLVGEATPETLLRYAQAHLSLWQVPKAVWVLPALPVNAQGKVSRRALAQRYQSVKESPTS